MVVLCVVSCLYISSGDDYRDFISILLVNNQCWLLVEVRSTVVDVEPRLWPRPTQSVVLIGFSVPHVRI
jgi:hypothetical protein